MTTDVVLDLETFGTAPDSAVVSIGAVNVANDNWFYGVIANPSGAVDAGAVRWWLNQAPEVREAVKVGQDEQEVLGAFMCWLTDEARGQGTPEFPRTIRLWGSEDFDTVILGNAYRRNGAEPPWRRIVYARPDGSVSTLAATTGGHRSNAEHAAAAAGMGIDWMNKAELAEAIPPAYTEYIGARLLAVVNAAGGCLKPETHTTYAGPDQQRPNLNTGVRTPQGGKDDG